MGRIFIASMSHDRRHAEMVDAALTAAGYTTWVEWRDLATGVRWEWAVRHALKECALLVFVLTRASGSADLMMTACRVAKEEDVPVLTLCMHEDAKADAAVEALLQPALWLDCFEPAAGSPNLMLMNLVEKLVPRPEKGESGKETRRVPREEDPYHELGSLANRPGMFCGVCGTDNPEFLAACRSCGASMLLDLRSEATHFPCPVCTSINPPDAKWCRVCGSDLHAPAPEDEVDPSEKPTEPAPLPLLPYVTAPCGPECVGRLVGPWRLLRWIGRGGQGSVYEAMHVYLRTAAALKVLRMTAGAAGLFHSRNGDSIRRGLRGLAVLESPHVAKTLDFGESDLPEGPRYFIVSELVRGQSLRDLIPELAKDSEESFQEAMRLFRQLCLAVQAAHEVRYFDDAGFELVGVRHGDIKPANAIVSLRGELKLIDFLLFKEVPTNGSDDMQTCAAGTFGYMAPEQLRDGVISIATDVYGLGATLLQMLTLALPRDFSAVETEAFAVEVAAKNARARAILPMLRRCLAEKPEGRYASVQELVAELPGGGEGRGRERD